MYVLLGAVVTAFGMLTAWGGLMGYEASMIAAVIDPQSLVNAPTGTKLGPGQGTVHTPTAGNSSSTAKRVASVSAGLTKNNTQMVNETHNVLWDILHSIGL